MPNFWPSLLVWINETSFWNKRGRLNCSIIPKILLFALFKFSSLKYQRTVFSRELWLILLDILASLWTPRLQPNPMIPAKKVLFSGRPQCFLIFQCSKLFIKEVTLLTVDSISNKEINLSCGNRSMTWVSDASFSLAGGVVTIMWSYWSKRTKRFSSFKIRLLTNWKVSWMILSKDVRILWASVNSVNPARFKRLSLSSIHTFLEIRYLSKDLYL